MFLIVTEGIKKRGNEFSIFNTNSGSNFHAIQQTELV